MATTVQVVTDTLDLEAYPAVISGRFRKGLPLTVDSPISQVLVEY